MIIEKIQVQLISRKLTDGIHGLLFSSGLVQVAGLAATTVVGIELARLLGPVSYGTYGVVMSVVAIAAVLAQFGLPLLATKEAAAARSQNSEPRSLLWWFLGRSSALAFVTMLGFGVLAFVFLSSRMSNDVVLYAAVVMFLISILPTCCGILRGFGKNITGQVADLLARPLITMCILYILYRLDFLSVKTALVAQALAAASSICFCLYSIINEAGGNTKPGIWSPPAGWFSTSSAFFASALLLALNSNYPMIIASFFVPAAELGVFKVALASAAIIGLPAAAANISMSPVISSLWAQGDTLALRRAMAQTTALTFFTTLLGVALFILIGRDLLKLLFGAQYAGAYIPLLILSVAQLIVSAFGTTGSFLNMTGRERLAIRAFAVAVPVGLISAFPLTVVFGVSGAAAGNIVMVSLWHWIVLYQHRQDVEVPVSIHSAIRFLRDRS